MSKITPGQMKRLHALLNELGLKETKPELVYQVSNGRTASSKELGVDEAAALITHLSDKLPKKERSPIEIRCDQMRKKVFSLFRSMGYIYGDTEADRKMNQTIIYAMIKKIGYLKKDLNKYTFDELPKLVSQVEGMSRNNNKAAAITAVKDLLKELNIEVK